jgi:tripartite-type tricarboxylate transporter receptor subunit TctC
MAPWFVDAMNNSNVHRRRFFIGMACAWGIQNAAMAQAPVKPLRLIVPFPAGGTADVLPRLLAEKLRAQYPGGVVIENRAGAGGNIGAESVFRSEADGLTLLASPPGPVAINQHLYPKLSFNPALWTPVTIMATVPNVLAVNNKLPVNNVAELISYLKANPGKVTYASQGNGSTSHLTANLFMSLTVTDMIHVPYKGTAPALVDLMGGQVDLFFDNLSSSLQHHQANKLRILAVADEQRSSLLASVPTFADAKLPAMNSITWFAVVAPPNTPPAIITNLQRAFAAAIALPDIRMKFLEQGAEPRGWSVEQTQRFIKGESDKWSAVIKSAKVALD